MYEEALRIVKKVTDTAYVEGTSASWEILLFVVGLILLAVEIFVIPGFGVAGISGIIAVVLSLAFAMIDNAELYTFDGSLTLTPLLMPVATVVFSITVAVFGSIWIVRKLLTVRSLSGVAHFLRPPYPEANASSPQVSRSKIETSTLSLPVEYPIW